MQGVTLTLDTTRYALPAQQLTVAGEPRLYFYYRTDDQAAELRATPTGPVRGLRLPALGRFQGARFAGARRRRQLPRHGALPQPHGHALRAAGVCGHRRLGGAARASSRS
ncbi:MAG: hypothetical protein WKG07_12315 [Hymenobacter sp.]